MFTPLQYACLHDTTGDTVKLLLNHDCRVNNMGTLLVSPLHLAAKYGQQAVVRFLLSQGADPRLRDALNRTPLQLAWAQPVRELLLKAQADPPIAPTPVCCSCLHGRKDTVRKKGGKRESGGGIGVEKEKGDREVATFVLLGPVLRLVLSKKVPMCKHAA